MRPATKVFTIKPHKVHSIGVDDAAHMWAQLRASLEKIYEEQHSQLSYEENYRLAYNLTLHKHGDFLYESVSTVVRYWLVDELKRIRASDTGALLGRVRELYDKHKVKMGLIRDIMLYHVRAS